MNVCQKVKTLAMDHNIIMISIMDVIRSAVVKVLREELYIEGGDIIDAGFDGYHHILDGETTVLAERNDPMNIYCKETILVWGTINRMMVMDEIKQVEDVGERADCLDDKSVLDK